MDGCVALSMGWRAQVGVCLKQFDVDAAMEHPSSAEAVGGCVGCRMLDIGARFGTGLGNGWLRGVEHWVACSTAHAQNNLTWMQ